MPRTTTDDRVPAPAHPGAPAGAGPGDATTETIDRALLSVARVMNQVRVHAQLLAQARVDIDRAGAALLYKLLVEGTSLRLCDLAERLGIDSPAVTRKVHHLEHLGLVVRSPDPVDGRAARLALTADGTRTIERLLEARRTWLEELLAGWPAPDRREFGRLLQLFAATIEDDVEARHGH